MSPRKFLISAGLILVLIAVAGFSRLFEFVPTDPARNWTMLCLGLLSLLFASAIPAFTHKYVVIFQGIAAFAISFSSFFIQKFLGFTLSFPFDTILFALLGIWALFAVAKNHSAIVNRYTDSAN